MRSYLCVAKESTVYSGSDEVDCKCKCIVANA